MSEPLYKKLYQEIKVQILNGLYKDGDLLPSEHELTRIHQVNRSTVRQALGELATDDYIVKKQGLGSVVTSPQRKSIGLLTIKGLTTAVGKYSKQKVKTRMIKKPVVQSWDEDFFFPVSGIEESAGCIYLRRIRLVDEDPVMLEDTCISNLNLPRFCSTTFINDSLFETLHVKYQLEMTKVEQDMRAVMANEEEAAMLNTTTDKPLIRTYMRFHTNRKNLYLYSTLLCNTEKYTIGNIL